LIHKQRIFDPEIILPGNPSTIFFIFHNSNNLIPALTMFL
jgi:hypothetical protein